MEIGLMYLSLFLFAKLAIMTPFLIFSTPDTSSLRVQTPTQQSDSETQTRERAVTAHSDPTPEVSAQPLYLLLISVTPFFASIFIGGSRWFDYRHQGVDIVGGLLIGAAAAVFSFDYYHVSLASSAYGGRAWGPRSGNGFWSVNSACRGTNSGVGGREGESESVGGQRVGEESVLDGRSPSGHGEGTERIDGATMRREDLMNGTTSAV